MEHTELDCDGRAMKGRRCGGLICGIGIECSWGVLLSPCSILEKVWSTSRDLARTFGLGAGRLQELVRSGTGQMYGPGVLK